MLMFGFALAACCMPAQDDWLNDLSSTPPVSSTMHASIFLPHGVPVETGVVLVPPAWVVTGAGLGAEVLPPALPPPLLLLPHADMTSAMAAIPAIAALVRRPRTMFSSLRLPTGSALGNIPTAPSYAQRGYPPREPSQGSGGGFARVVTRSLP